jgi:hypothetical protein
MIPMSHESLVSLTVAALAFAFAGSAQAQVFKCVDANGKTVYSQSPCPKGSKSSTLSKTPPPASSAPADKKGDAKAAAKPGATTAAEKDMEFRKRQQEKEEADKKAAQDAAQTKQAQENCARAKEQVAQYDIGGRMSRINAQGERVYLGDDEIAAERAKAQASVAQNCK